MLQQSSFIQPSPSFFPLKLMEMLANEDLSTIVSWLPDGDAFVIRDKKIFATEVIPLYFKGSIQFSSFTRRMNRWKFTLSKQSTKSESIYQHPLFRRDEIERCILMKPKPQIIKKVSSSKKFYDQEVADVRAPVAVAMKGTGQEHGQSLSPYYLTHYSTVLTPREQEMHLRNMQIDPAYQDCYLSSVNETYARHQAHLAMQMRLSHFAMRSSMAMVKYSP
mmetsp:Transcript_4224/g.4824  ORF Transcript_4224/g.4824 Transcript_4224/m.4824 type:complete len:220 (+) Transcript_4224:79-738(+)